MPPRSAPSERQRRLGAELRKLRTRARLSGDDVAALLQADRSRVSHIEAGRVDVPRNGLYKLLHAYGCERGPLFEALMNMAHDRGKGWWDAYRDVMEQRALDLAELEARTTSVRIHEPSVIPGMLQTKEYARAVISNVAHDHEHLDRWVDFRLARQAVMSGLERYHAVIHESALRTRVGDAKTMRKQLLRLIEVARLPHVTVQIFPFEMGPYSSHMRSFVLFGGSTPELDTLYREHPTNADFIGDSNRIGEYVRMFERLASLALEPLDPAAPPEAQENQDSLSLLQHVLYELR
ncbi:helix-turn-helix domain-containing protein [Streptomyces triculaminicus]|uniref:Helix-turn-helix domain-containing protein n=3 Tax=Streptomyces TaxID=1883 RepID=A0A939FJ14_9ACTN|nr:MULTISPECIES: helix-turn-helix transcriptional regulator [Streptomyces]MBO0652895.1 helix-turn-helix domain-containing protein [Streptomyces triculaminicus]QSY52384.1 helix-turn-helix domain-containing protein [Streptomyces griseocarneus]